MTEILKIENINDIPNDIFEKISNTLLSGGVILYPTDTQYGLGALVNNVSAIERIKKIKNRDPSKAISMIVANQEMLNQCLETNEVAEDLIEKYLPGALTLILKSKNKEVSDNIGQDNKIGVRIPKMPFILKIVEKINCPITTTSANVSGLENKKSVSEILEQLGENSKIIDIAIDIGDLNNPASTIVDVSEGKVVVVREGVLKIDL